VEAIQECTDEVLEAVKTELKEKLRIPNILKAEIENKGHK